MPAPSLLNLDLCLLAYQIYHQSVVWPMDPWYELMAKRWSDRRDLFLPAVRDWIANPMAAVQPPLPESAPPASTDYYNPPNLDPVLSTYNTFDPHQPAITFDGEKWIAVKAPDYLTQPIGRVLLCQYTGLPAAQAPAIVPLAVGAGNDVLIAFEGSTGEIANSVNRIRSLMGCVVARARAGGGYDVYIAFRGSRSGSVLARTITQALRDRGNSDWVTDLGSTSFINDPQVSQFGLVAEGFALALPDSLPTIQAALTWLHGQQGGVPPLSITVTGHSLGAALAAQFTSAVVSGDFGPVLSAALPAWPWSAIACISYAQPPVGSHDWQQIAMLRSTGAYIWVTGDAVVMKSKIPAQLKLHNPHHLGANVELARPPAPPGNPHEPSVIRSAVVLGLNVNLQANEQADWDYFESFWGLYDAKVGPAAPAPPWNLRLILQRYHFEYWWTAYRFLVANVYQDPRSHKRPFRDQDTLRAQAQALRDLQDFNAIANNTAAIYARLIAQRDIIYQIFDATTMIGNVHKSETAPFIWLGQILCGFEHGLDFAQLTPAEQDRLRTAQGF